MARQFPCPYCKGTGIIEDGETQDGIKISPDIPCNYCNGEGMIVIGSKIHKEHFLERMTLDLLSFFSKDFEIGFPDIQMISDDLENIAKKYLKKESNNE